MTQQATDTIEKTITGRVKCLFGIHTFIPKIFIPKIHFKEPFHYFCQHCPYVKVVVDDEIIGIYMRVNRTGGGGPMG